MFTQTCQTLNMSSELVFFVSTRLSWAKWIQKDEEQRETDSSRGYMGYMFNSAKASKTYRSTAATARQTGSEICARPHGDWLFLSAPPEAPSLLVHGWWRLSGESSSPAGRSWWTHLEALSALLRARCPCASSRHWPRSLTDGPWLSLPSSLWVRLPRTWQE